MSTLAIEKTAPPAPAPKKPRIIPVATTLAATLAARTDSETEPAVVDAAKPASVEVKASAEVKEKTVKKKEEAKTTAAKDAAKKATAETAKDAAETAKKAADEQKAAEAKKAALEEAKRQKNINDIKKKLANHILPLEEAKKECNNNSLQNEQICKNEYTYKFFYWIKRPYNAITGLIDQTFEKESYLRKTFTELYTTINNYKKGIGSIIVVVTFFLTLKTNLLKKYKELQNLNKIIDKLFTNMMNGGGNSVLSNMYNTAITSLSVAAVTNLIVSALNTTNMNLPQKEINILLLLCYFIYQIYLLIKDNTNKQVDDYNEQKNNIDKILDNNINENNIINNTDITCLDNDTCASYLATCAGDANNFTECVEWFNPTNTNSMVNMPMNMKIIQNFIKTLKWPVTMDKVDGYKRNNDNIMYGIILSCLENLLILAQNKNKNFDRIISNIKNELNNINLDTTNNNVKSIVERLISHVNDLSNDDIKDSINYFTETKQIIATFYKNTQDNDIKIYPIQIVRLKSIKDWADSSPKIKDLFNNNQFKILVNKIYKLTLEYPEILNNEYKFPKQNTITTNKYGLSTPFALNQNNQYFNPPIENIHIAQNQLNLIYNQNLDALSILEFIKSNVSNNMIGGAKPSYKYIEPVLKGMWNKNMNILTNKYKLSLSNVNDIMNSYLEKLKETEMKVNQLMQIVADTKEDDVEYGGIVNNNVITKVLEKKLKKVYKMGLNIINGQIHIINDVQK